MLTSLLHVFYFRPCAIYPDPIRGGDNVLVMCEVLDPEGSPHATNTRALLADLLTDDIKAQEPMYGFEQVSISNTFQVNNMYYVFIIYVSFMYHQQGVTALVCKAFGWDLAWSDIFKDCACENSG